MNHRNTVQITTAILLAITTASVFAVDPAVSARGPVPFERFDADGDGKLYLNEVQAHQRERQDVRNKYREQKRMDRSMNNAGMGMGGRK